MTQTAFCREPGLPRAFALHSFRHTFASQAIKRGCDVVTLQRLLGHLRASTTLDHYAHLVDHRAQEVVDLLDDLAMNESPNARETRAEGA